MNCDHVQFEDPFEPIDILHKHLLGSADARVVDKKSDGGV
jgi:hypothetical protein